MKKHIILTLLILLLSINHVKADTGEEWVNRGTDFSEKGEYEEALDRALESLIMQ